MICRLLRRSPGSKRRALSSLPLAVDCLEQRTLLSVTVYNLTVEWPRPDFQLTFVAPATPTGFQATSGASSSELRWNESAGAAAYDLWIVSANRQTGSALRVTTAELTWSTPAAFPEGPYRAYVRAASQGQDPEYSGWTTAAEFYHGSDPSMALLGSSDGANPTFRWVSPAGIQSVELWLTNRDTKTRTLYLQGLTGNSYATQEPLEPAHYAVWVRGTRADGSRTDWSDLTEFDVLA